jgi:hypothetical protein
MKVMNAVKPEADLHPPPEQTDTRECGALTLGVRDLFTVFKAQALNDTPVHPARAAHWKEIQKKYERQHPIRDNCGYHIKNWIQAEIDMAVACEESPTPVPPTPPQTPKATPPVVKNRFRDVFLNRPSRTVLQELHEPCMRQLAHMATLTENPDFYPLPCPIVTTSDDRSYALMCSGIITCGGHQYNIKFVIDNKSPANSEFSLIDPFEGGPFVRSADGVGGDKFWVRPIALKDRTLIRFFAESSGGTVNSMRMRYVVRGNQLVEVDEEEWIRLGGGRKHD